MFLLLTLSLALAADSPTGTIEPDPVLTVATAELDRVMEALADSEEPPYFLSYGIVDTHVHRLSASNGALVADWEDHNRVADVDVRVGSPELDNTHKIRDASWFSEEMRSQVRLPLDGDPYATSMILWRETDDAWQAAVRRLTKVKANESVKVEREDQSADFSVGVEPVVWVEAPAAVDLDPEAWTGALRAASAIFLEYPEVYDSGVELFAQSSLSLFTTSEGTQLQQSRVRYRASVWGSTVAEDGMRLQVYDYVDVGESGALPDPVALQAMARQVAERVVALRQAPLLEPYTGPAILRGRAAGVFFHEVFGHRMEGHRQKDEDEGQTFTDMVGEAILPDFLSVVDDPTLSLYGGADLNGHYDYDDEGVPAQRVQLVDRGVLQTFLLSRMPVEGFADSNGHGRRQPGHAVVARQGNLIVEAHETVPYAKLRAMLLKQVETQGKEFGLIVDDITGGFTLTGRVVPNSFNVRPVAVWKVYADGRPDELVRGGDLIGTPLTTFANILAAGDDIDVFNGVCGAESGWVPVSASSPSLLLSEIEVQRKEKENDRPPLLDPPGAAALKKEES